MTLEDIEVASVSSLGKKGNSWSLSLPLSPCVSLSLFLICLIRDEIYWPASHFTDSLTPHFLGGNLSHSLILCVHLCVIRNRALDELII